METYLFCKVGREMNKESRKYDTLSFSFLTFSTLFSIQGRECSSLESAVRGVYSCCWKKSAYA